MIEAIRDGFTYGYGQVSYAASSVGSLTVSTGRKAVTLLTSATHQVGSVIYRIYSAVCCIIAHINEYLFGTATNAAILKQIEQDWRKIISSKMPSLEPYISNGMDVGFQVLRRCPEYRLSSRTHLVEYFEVAFNVNGHIYSSLLRIVVDKRSGSIQSGREKPFNLQVISEYLMDGQGSDDQQDLVHFLSLQLLIDVKMYLALAHPTLRAILCDTQREHLLHIHTARRFMGESYQTWTFHTSEEDISIDVRLNADGVGETDIAVFCQTVKIVTHPSIMRKQDEIRKFALQEASKGAFEPFVPKEGVSSFEIIQWYNSCANNENTIMSFAEGKYQFDGEKCFALVTVETNKSTLKDTGRIPCLSNVPMMSLIPPKLLLLDIVVEIETLYKDDQDFQSVYDTQSPCFLTVDESTLSSNTIRLSWMFYTPEKSVSIPVALHRNKQGEIATFTIQDTLQVEKR